jgi:DHA2 family multidrug resistance protein-like MFS transporter
VIGSALSTRYQDRMTAALNGRPIPAAAAQTILGSIGGALVVAKRVGGHTGILLARAARDAFMSGAEISLLVGAIVALAGALLMIARLPSEGSTPPKTDPESDLRL